MNETPPICPERTLPDPGSLLCWSETGSLAVISAGAFGSHACFYGDASVLAASSSGCNLLAHVKTQIPYAVLAAAIAALGFLALGFLA